MISAARRVRRVSEPVLAAGEVSDERHDDYISCKAPKRSTQVRELLKVKWAVVITITVIVLCSAHSETPIVVEGSIVNADHSVDGSWRR